MANEAKVIFSDRGIYFGKKMGRRNKKLDFFSFLWKNQLFFLGGGGGYLIDLHYIIH